MDDTEREETAVAVVSEENAVTQAKSNHPKTLLPAPIASLISLAASTSSFGFRVGGYLGNAAIRSARIGTLTGLELGRVVLEGILSRAGQDVVATSAGDMGRTAAETLLERALSTLHYAITSGSFLVSTGFQIGSTGLTSGVTIAQYFLSALDAVFGDTETSKAIATIIVLIQKESRNPETGAKGERLTLADCVIGTISFGILQRWGKIRTDEEFCDTGSEEVVWDIVVIDHGRRLPSLPAIEEGTENLAVQSDVHGRGKERSTSFVSATGDAAPFEVYSADDGTSFISKVSSRPASAGNDHGRPEQAFRNQLIDQLPPGAQIRITAQSATTNSVTVEVIGDSTRDIQPPAGYTLVSSEAMEPSHSNSRKFVFSNSQKRLKQGSFEVDEMRELRRQYSPSALAKDGLPTFQFPSVEPTPVNQMPTNDVTPADFQRAAKQQAGAEPVAANQKKARMPLQTEQHPQGTQSPSTGFYRDQSKQKKASLRNTLRRGTSYKNLVDFWRDRDRFPKPGSFASDSTSHQWSAMQSGPTVPSPDEQYNAAAFAHSHLQWPSIDTSAGQNRAGYQMDGLGRRRSYQRHKRGPSSIYTMTETTSETSLVLYDSPDVADGDRIVSLLQRDGMLSETYPHAPLAQNLARFSRFASAAYGEQFLRLTGAITGETPALPPNEDTLSHRAEHRSFSSYINLPPSAVLLSSYVDPQGGTDASGQTETGMPLIHYVSLDHESKAVVLTCRGTLGFEDVLTDMTCDFANLQWRGRDYSVHTGILNSARRLLTLHGNRTITTLTATLEEFPDYGVVICGHSLGGGVAAILGILLSQPVMSSGTGAPAFVTNAIPTPKLIQAASTNETLPQSDLPKVSLPPNRRIHVYAFGPAACVSPELQQATRGLITTVCNGLDIVPYLSLGNLRDHQAICLAFKTDTQGAKAEIKRRVWEGFLDAVKDKTRTRSFFSNDWLESHDFAHHTDDQWPWAALKSLRASMTAEKLVPPGEVYTVESQSVLQRHAFVSQDVRDGAADSRAAADMATRTFKPATHITFTHVRDVAKRFGEIRFGASMFTDHIPGRYDRVLRLLEQGVDG